MSKRGRRLRQVMRKCPSCGRRMRRSIRDDYQYLESGLKNVRLNGVIVYQCQCGEELVELPHVHTLHTLIAEKLVTKPAPLTGSELRFVRKFVGLKSVDLARDLGVSPVTVSRWETGEEAIGKTNDQLFRFRMVLKVLAEQRKAAEAAYKVIGNGFLDLLAQIPSLRGEQSADEQVLIEAEAIDETQLVLRRFDMPDVIIDIDALPA